MTALINVPRGALSWVAGRGRRSRQIQGARLRDGQADADTRKVAGTKDVEVVPVRALLGRLGAAAQGKQAAQCHPVAWGGPERTSGVEPVSRLCEDPLGD